MMKQVEVKASSGGPGLRRSLGRRVRVPIVQEQSSGNISIDLIALFILVEIKW